MIEANIGNSRDAVYFVIVSLVVKNTAKKIITCYINQYKIYEDYN